MSQIVKKKRISKHCFRLIGRSDLYFKGQLIVNFAPLPKAKAKKHRSILPTFNHDKLSHTLSFQLPSAINENEDQILIQHNKRVAEATLQISDMMFPKPRSRHRYCGVCRGHYEDYKDHIQSDIHKIFTQKSPYQTLIRQFCEQVGLEKKELDQCKIMETTCEQVSVQLISVPDLYLDRSKF